MSQIRDDLARRCLAELDALKANHVRRLRSIDRWHRVRMASLVVAVVLVAIAPMIANGCRGASRVERPGLPLTTPPNPEK